MRKLILGILLIGNSQAATAQSYSPSSPVTPPAYDNSGSGSAITTNNGNNSFTTFDDGGSAITTRNGRNSFTTYSDGGTAITTTSRNGKNSFTTYSNGF